MINIEEILGEYMQLVTDLRFTTNTYQLSVKFGNQIKPIKDSNNQILIKSGANGIFTYEISKQTGLETLALFLKKTIDQNLEAHAKGELYNQKLKELQKIFTEYSLDELQSLRFIVGEEGNETIADNKVDFTKQLENANISSSEIVVETKAAVSGASVEEAKKAPEVKNVPSQPQQKAADEPQWENYDEEPELKKENGLVSGKVNVIM